MKDFRGTGVAMITPFNASGEVDYGALSSLVETYIQSGIDFLVVLGTTAETVTLSQEEQIKVTRKVAQFNAARLPLMLGKGGNNTRALINDLNTTDFSGYSAILSVCPYYNRPNQEGIYQHFSAIAEASPLPVMLYNVPARTGASIENDTVIRLAQAHDNIFGIKDATGDVNIGNALIEALPNDFLVSSGEDLTALDLVSKGGAGAISVIAGAFPKEFSQMIGLARQEDFSTAKQIEKDLLPFIDLIFREGNPTGLKVLLALQGKSENHLRLPLVPASQILQEQIKTQLETLTTKC
ncbi:MAG: 4-hydroxy-tetrahydrodipicolinate synthase [Flavobacteriaceae bacterium]|nr:4-hydroxy-tetrahydrodipicolinate synthase [Flavobacteriaceae bacterium]